MSFDDKLIEVGLVLIVFLPIAGLFSWRWWRGEVRFYGFWVTPREFKEIERKEARGEWPPSGPEER